ncbi:T-cell activation inhibitor, mitochondrial-like [Mizuhopecten yessoensis]|uniref:T-cell activation inhibitor, mitochondrial-like n=1 Tax=Mizuhopecten yessoensis TaxID=6573 RepID=UPI000B45CCA3|nr:T-cell activation inhibitor, mitochondrial-like [Mizuhopecten yessoensis]
MHKLYSNCLRVAGSLQTLNRNILQLTESVKTLNRCLSINETATALRPFYFVVHPDLFGQHPKERKVNEESLKRLHEYLTSLRKTGTATPTELVFFVRPQQNEDLSSVKVNLQSESLRSTVTSVLSSVHLPLDFVQNIPKKRYRRVDIRWDPTYYHVTGQKNPYKEYYKRKKEWTLLDWLQKNSNKAVAKQLLCHQIQQEIAAIEREVIPGIGLKKLVWKNDWGSIHCLASLKSFHRMFQEHPAKTRHALKDKTLVFSKKTGVSAQGDVILSMEAVPSDWLKMLSLVDAYDGMVNRLPFMESKLSGLLADIRVTCPDRLIMAEEYELLLNQILNILRHSQAEVNHYLWDGDLSHLQLIVEGGEAPLTLSSSGQFIVPATVPGSMIVKFIADNKEMAFTVIQDMELLMRMEDVVQEQCKDRLQLTSISRDESVTPKQMISCCERLLEDAVYLSALSGGSVRVSNYYAVMKDGGISIPWNWKSDIS